MSADTNMIQARLKTLKSYVVIIYQNNIKRQKVIINVSGNEKLFLKDGILNCVLVWPDFTFHIDPQYEKLKFESGLG